MEMRQFQKGRRKQPNDGSCVTFLTPLPPPPFYFFLYIHTSTAIGVGFSSKTTITDMGTYGDP